MKAPGFSMLEFLVYHALFCFLAFLGMIIIARSCMSIKMQEGQEQAFLDSSLAYDLFARDVYHAPADKQLWKHASDTAIIWHDAHTKNDKGWCWQQQCLYSIEGNYDKDKQQWLSARKSLVASQVTKAQFSLHEHNDMIIAVSLVIPLLSGEQWYVGIRSRKHI